MPEYALRCDNPQCTQHRQKIEAVCTFDARASLRCSGCGGELAVHPDQYASVRPEREWHGMERDNLEIAFAPDADVASIKRDVPAMELRRTKAGYLKPVSRNDRHDRQWKSQLAAKRREYEQGAVQ